MKKAISEYILIGLLVFFLSMNAYAQGPGPVAPPPPIAGEDLWLHGLKPSAIERVASGIFRIGEIVLDKKKRSMTFPAMVNMDKGLLEYLIVFATGKTHESLLRTNVPPYNLQIAFLLLGFEGTNSPLQGQGDPAKPKGDPVEIIVSFDKGGKTENIHAEEWVALKANETLKDAGRIEWIFTGSLVVMNQFLAQSSGSIVAIYHDPTAIIDNASKGGESDEVWFVKEKVVPPVGTPIVVTIRPAKTRDIKEEVK
jgi:hypothetical protein